MPSAALEKAPPPRGFFFGRTVPPRLARLREAVQEDVLFVLRRLLDRPQENDEPLRPPDLLAVNLEVPDELRE